MKVSNTIIMICAFLFATSCSKSDDNNDVTNAGTLTIKEIDYNLVGGIIYDRIEEEGDISYNFDIDLYTEGIDPVTETGFGHLAAMELYTSRSDDLAPGTYKHDIDETLPAGTFTGNILLGMDVEAETITAWYITTSGTVVVGKSGSVYELNMNMTADEYDITDEFDFIKTDSNVIITCNYKGTLEARNELIK